LPLSEQALAEVRAPRVALVTGATGFVGRHLIDALLQTSWSVVALTRRGPTPPDTERCRFLVADLREPARMERALGEAAPDYIFHLAAATPPTPDSRILAVNLMASTTLFELLVREATGVRVLVVGSDAQYGSLGPEHRPTPETAPMRPLGTYGRSKVLQEAVALQYAAMAHLGVVCVRPFNIVGPGQSTQFVVGKMVQHIARAEAGKASSSIEVGNLDVARDFTDVRDVARAFVQAILGGTPAEVYNIGSGVATSIGDVARTLASMARTPITFRPVHRRFRALDVSTTRCDASKLRAATGWAPTIPMEQSLNDALHHARDALARQRPFRQQPGRLDQQAGRLGRQPGYLDQQEG
jgi:GDP-4-dehydro-6-deoxy-D-mannose reductase